MKKLKLYLETSVWNFIFADDAPELRNLTLQFFAMVERQVYDVYISDAVSVMNGYHRRVEIITPMEVLYAENP